MSKQTPEGFWEAENQWWTKQANEEQAGGNKYQEHAYRTAAHAIRMARDKWNARVEPAEAAGASVPQEAAPTGIALIAAERQRQIDREGWTPEHDDHHGRGELVVAAACYFTYAAGQVGIQGVEQPVWPWESSWWKPSADPVRNLVKASALIAAEIDRRLRLTGEASSAPQGQR